MKQYLRNDNGFVEVDEWSPDVWVNIECPDEADNDYLSRELGVPLSFLESLSDVDERPRVDAENGWMLTILRVPVPDASGTMPYTTVPFGIITNDDYILTVCCHATEMVPDFINYTRRRCIEVRTRPDFVLRILFSATSWFLHYLKQINSAVQSVEHELEKSVRNDDLLGLMRHQKTLVFFNTSIRGNEVLLERLRSIYGEEINADLLEDLEIEMKQADNTVSVYSDILAAAMDAFASIISNNVNAIMKRMTAISIILMVPTLIASLYGMNVAGLWPATVPGAFALVIVMAVVLTFAAWMLLKKLKWF